MRNSGVIESIVEEAALVWLQSVCWCIAHGSEVRPAATAKDFIVVHPEDRWRVQQHVKHYNLDAIISVGYLVNSKRAGALSPMGATRTLREHFVRALNC